MRLVRHYPISSLKRRFQDANESFHCRRRIVFAAGGRQQRISLGPSEFTISNAWHGHSPNDAGTKAQPMPAATRHKIVGMSGARLTILGTNLPSAAIS
jgi:hypothetical protein